MGEAEPVNVIEHTDDAFLGGALSLLQPVRGFRAGADSMFLAASLAAAGGDAVLDVGAGVGAVGLSIAKRLPGVSVTCLEVQPELAALAEHNAERNGLDAEIDIVCGDIAAVPKRIKSRVFTHVVSNPPYHEVGRSRTSAEGSRALARVEGQVSLTEWVSFCLRRTDPGGSTTIILPPARLVDVLAAMRQGAGGIVIFPLWPRQGVAAKRLIVQGIKGSDAPLRMSAGLVLHDRAGGYSAAAEAVLRHGCALDLGAA